MPFKMLRNHLLSLKLSNNKYSATTHKIWILNNSIETNEIKQRSHLECKEYLNIPFKYALILKIIHTQGPTAVKL